MPIFSLTSPDPAVLTIDPTDATNIPAFVEQAKTHGAMSSISVGGWTGSRYFSTAVTPANRSTFVNAVLNLTSKYNFDGVDFE